MKKHALKFLLVLALAPFILGASCKSARLETGGAYAPVGPDGTAIVQPDLAFYQADAAYDLAYSAIDAAFKFEYDNRALLWRVSPNVKHTLDQIRPQAVAANLQWAKARQVYIANPVPANLTGLQAVLAKVQQLSATATSAIPK